MNAYLPGLYLFYRRIVGGGSHGKIGAGVNQSKIVGFRQGLHILLGRFNGRAFYLRSWLIDQPGSAGRAPAFVSSRPRAAVMDGSLTKLGVVRSRRLELPRVAPLAP